MEIQGNKNGTLSKIKSAVLNTKSDIFGPTNRLSRVTEWIESEYSIPRDEFDIRYHHDIVESSQGHYYVMILKESINEDILKSALQNRDDLSYEDTEESTVAIMNYNETGDSGVDKSLKTNINTDTNDIRINLSIEPDSIKPNTATNNKLSVLGLYFSEI